MSQGQLALLEQTTNDTAGVAYASLNSWVIKTSKSLSYELRRNSKRSLGRLNDAQFENLPMLQAFKCSPVKILAFLLSNSKSRFAIHLQLRDFMYERVEEWDIYISLSAFQGHTRYSDIASDESYGKKLTIGRPDEPRQGVPLHQEPQLGVHQQRRASKKEENRRESGGKPDKNRRKTGGTREEASQVSRNLELTQTGPPRQESCVSA